MILKEIAGLGHRTNRRLRGQPPGADCAPSRPAASRPRQVPQGSATERATDDHIGANASLLNTAGQPNRKLA